MKSKIFISLSFSMISGLAQAEFKRNGEMRPADIVVPNPNTFIGTLYRHKEMKPLVGYEAKIYASDAIGNRIGDPLGVAVTDEKGDFKFLDKKGELMFLENRNDSKQCKKDVCVDDYDYVVDLGSKTFQISVLDIAKREGMDHDGPFHAHFFVDASVIERSQRGSH